MERKNSAPTKPPTNPIPTVMSDHAISETVISHLRESLSPMNPAMTVIAASVQERTVLIQPICTSVSLSSAWIGTVRSPKSARSA